MSNWLEKLEALYEDLEDRADDLEPDGFRALEKRAQKLVDDPDTDFESVAKAQTHLLEHDPEMREAYLRGTGADARQHVEKRDAGLERRAEELVAKGRFTSLGAAMTHLLETDSELAARYREGR